MGVRKHMIGFLGDLCFLEHHCCLFTLEASSGSVSQSHRLHARLLLSLSALELPHIVVPWEFCVHGTSEMLNVNG